MAPDAPSKATAAARACVFVLFANAALHTAALGQYILNTLHDPRRPEAVVHFYGVPAEWMAVAAAAAFSLGALTWFLWLRAADAIARARHPHLLDYRPQWLILSYLTPILNVSEPLEIIKKLWTASDPRLASNPDLRERMRAVPVYADWWWIGFLLGFCFGIVEINLKQSPERWFLGAASHFLLAGSAWLAAKIVRRVTTLQFQPAA